MSFELQFSSAAHPDLLKKLRTKPWLRDKPQTILFKNAALVDPSTSLAYQNVDVLIKDGLVAAVRRDTAYNQGDHSYVFIDSYLDGLDVSEEDSPKIIDLEGKFLCPGLIDCHVHVTAVPGVKTMSDAMKLPDTVVHLRSTYILREMLSRGFTTVRDTGGATAELAEAIDEWLILGPRLIHCGKSLSQTGGHGDFRPINMPIQTDTCCGGHQPGLGVTCDGVPQVLATVRNEIRKGAKFIKIMCGGGVASPTDFLESIQFTAEEIRAITTTCRQMGNIHTTAHAYSVEAIRHAIDNGVMGIEHGNFIDAPTACYMAEKGIFLTPTLSCYGIMVRPPFEDFLDEASKKKNADVMKAGLQAMQIAETAGVTVCYGTDLLVSMHALQTEEFSVRAKVLPSEAVLRHATVNAARLLRLEGKMGQIIPGAYADMIILDADPLQDITVLDRPEKHLLAVIKSGYVCNSRLGNLSVDML